METDGTIHVSGVKRLVRAKGADLSGSSFTDVNLSGVNFSNVNIAGARIEDANLCDWSVRNANLTRLRVMNADLRDASFSDCLTLGLTIDGVDLTDLMAAYRALNARPD
jgi:uncharacterized protein YjbI with pentapeptide repeats